jgi:hypothetical protein
MNKWTAWTAACILGVGVYFILPLCSAAVEGWQLAKQATSSTISQALEPTDYTLASDEVSPTASTLSQTSTVDVSRTSLALSSTESSQPSTSLNGSATNTKPTARLKTTSTKASTASTASSAQAHATAKPVTNKPAEQPTPKIDPLDETVEKWKLALSKERGFESWQKATWNSYPLGPGTHGWIILLYNDGKEVGYMVIHASEDGKLKLTEYGSGDKPLYSLSTLYRSLVQHELIPDTMAFAVFINDKSIIKERWYADAFHALWKVTISDQVLYLDAKTGEILPIKQLPKPAPAPITKATSLTGKIDQLLLPSFDPYDHLPWVKGKPIAIKQLQELKTTLQKQPKLTYVTVQYEEQVTIPLAVLGYRQWGTDEPYLVLDQEGARYVPLALALEQGNLYP